MEGTFRIHRFFGHIYHGTLLGLIESEWSEYVKRRRLAWWQRHVGGNERFIHKLQAGIKMYHYFDSRLSQAIYCYDFELNERHFFNSYLRQGDVVVDIGANIGLFTLTSSRCIGNSGQVYSIEPCRKTYRRLVDNVELNHMNNVQCYQLALSDHTGQIEMNVSLDGYDAWNSIVQPIAGRSFVKERVSAVKWDDFVYDHHLTGRVNLMKIDVEGWESHVLSGGYETLKRKDAPALQIEFTDEASQSAGTSCQTLYRQLQELGYQMFIYEAKSKRIIPDPIRDSYPYINLLATKNPEDINSRLKKH
jgi:FkbM family methyltransferase